MGANKAHRLIMKENPQGDLAVNDLDMAVYVANLHIFAPLLKPLYHIDTKVDKTAAEGWAKRVSVSSATAIGPLLH